ncbi:hypothetical protein Q7P36_007842 [Cladosporium allicinum]
MQVYGNSRVLSIRAACCTLRASAAAEQTPSFELSCTRSSRRGQTRISQAASKPHPPVRIASLNPLKPHETAAAASSTVKARDTHGVVQRVNGTTTPYLEIHHRPTT